MAEDKKPELHELAESLNLKDGIRVEHRYPRGAHKLTPRRLTRNLPNEDTHIPPASGHHSR